MALSRSRKLACQRQLFLSDGFQSLGPERLCIGSVNKLNKCEFRGVTACNRHLKFTIRSAELKSDWLYLHRVHGK